MPVGPGFAALAHAWADSTKWKTVAVAGGVFCFMFTYLTLFFCSMAMDGLESGFIPNWVAGIMFGFAIFLACFGVLSMIYTVLRVRGLGFLERAQFAMVEAGYATKDQLISDYNKTRYQKLVSGFIEIEWMVLSAVRSQLWAQRLDTEWRNKGPKDISEVLEILSRNLESYAPRLFDYKVFDGTTNEQLETQLLLLKDNMSRYSKVELKGYYISGVQDFEKEVLSKVVAMHAQPIGGIFVNHG